MSTQKHPAGSPLENDIAGHLKQLSPDNKYLDLQYNMAMKVIESFPVSKRHGKTLNWMWYLKNNKTSNGERRR